MMKHALLILVVMAGPAFADFRIEKQGERDQVVGEPADRKVLVCQNEGSTILYVYPENTSARTAPQESRVRLQLRNGYFTLGAYATEKGSLERIDAYVSGLPADQKLDCTKPALEQEAQVRLVLNEIGKVLPAGETVPTIPNYQIIAGTSSSGTLMADASCSIVTIEQLNASLLAKETFFTVGDFRHERFCR